jgi:hypothetical protein
MVVAGASGRARVARRGVRWHHRPVMQAFFGFWFYGGDTPA